MVHGIKASRWVVFVYSNIILFGIWTWKYPLLRTGFQTHYYSFFINIQSTKGSFLLINALIIFNDNLYLLAWIQQKLQPPTCNIRTQIICFTWNIFLISFFPIFYYFYMLLKKIKTIKFIWKLFFMHCWKF